MVREVLYGYAFKHALTQIDELCDMAPEEFFEKLKGVRSRLLECRPGAAPILLKRAAPATPRVEQSAPPKGAFTPKVSETLPRACDVADKYDTIDFEEVNKPWGIVKILKLDSETVAVKEGVKGCGPDAVQTQGPNFTGT